MLVLTRRVGEVLRIDGDIRVVVVGIAGGQVRIGIDAPSERNVLREELHERVARANLAAASLGDARCEAESKVEAEDTQPGSACAADGASA